MFKARNFGLDLDALIGRLRQVDPPEPAGRVIQVVGLVVEASVPSAALGSLCLVELEDGRAAQAEVVGFRGQTALLMPLTGVEGVKMGSRVRVGRTQPTVRVGPELLGRVVDGLGVPLDGKALEAPSFEVPLYADPINPMEREPITTPMWLGIRAIDCLLTCGRGQRAGIFAGSGVGKSVTLGMMARYASSDVNVIALIGERGREVRRFIEHDLGPKGLARSVVVVATSDTAPLTRLRAAAFACSVAEYFRDQGKQVLMMMDSVTRYAMAQREIGLAAGEPPTTRGYPPSVFAKLPKLLERAGTCGGKGSITGLYTVLVEADDMNDPIGDTVRSIIDGHIVLSRDLAARNHYPAIDVLVSASRVMSDVADDRHRKAAGVLRSLLSAYKRAEDLINIGAYQKGANKTIDRAIAQIEAINQLLTQAVEERADPVASLKKLHGIVDGYGEGGRA